MQSFCLLQLFYPFPFLLILFTYSFASKNTDKLPFFSIDISFPCLSNGILLLEDLVQTVPSFMWHAFAIFQMLYINFNTFRFETYLGGELKDLSYWRHSLEEMKNVHPFQTFLGK